MSSSTSRHGTDDRAARQADHVAEGEDQSSDLLRAPEGDTGVRTMSMLQDLVGNDTMGDALGGEQLGGFGTAVATEITGALGGLEGGGPVTSLAAMRRLMRHAAELLDTARAARDISSSSGRRMDTDHQERMERAFEHDFDHVRVHTGSAAERAARALQAHAFALGSEVFFGPGAWRPGTTQGDRILAHELTHVVQHDQGRLPTASDDLEVSSPTDPHEREAYANETKILRKLSVVDEALEAEALEGPDAKAGPDAAVGPDETGPDEATPEVDTPEAEAADTGATDPATGLDAVDTTVEPSSDLQLGDDGDPAGDPTDDAPADGAPAMAKRNAGGGRLRRERASEARVDERAQVDDRARVDESAGSALPASVAERMGTAMGHDFDGVRVHTDGAAAEAARKLGARAFALGADVFFASGEFQPDSEQGQELLAHELAHVKQHDEGRLSSLFGPELHISQPGDAAEREADAEAEHAMAALEAADAALLQLAGLDEATSPEAARAVHADLATQGGHRVVDPDAERRDRTAALLMRLAPRLGLNASTVEVRVDDGARSHTTTAGSPGVMRGGTVWLDPASYDPDSRAGREILAHEVAHVAQDALPHDDVATGAHAEADAQLFAEDFAAGRGGDGVQVPLPAQHDARYDGPSSGDLGAQVKSYMELAKAREEMSKQKADAKRGDGPQQTVDAPSDKERDEVEEFEDGLDASIDEIQDLDAYDDAEDAHDDDEPMGRHLSRIKRTDHYENAVEMFKGALSHEDAGKASSMQSVWREEWDRESGGILGDEDEHAVLQALRRSAESDARAKIAEEEAEKAAAEEARRQEERASNEVNDQGGPEPGEGETGGEGGNSGEPPMPSLPNAVPQFPPEAPNYARAEARQDVWAEAEKEYALHETFTADMEAGQNRGWDRFSQVAEQVGAGFTSGFANGLSGGLRDKFLTDVVGGGVDRLIQSSPRFGGAMRGVPFAQNVIKGFQSGLWSDMASGDFFTGEGQVWQGWEDKGKKAGEALDGMGAVIDNWSDYSGWDRVALAIKFAADLVQFFAEIFGLITDVLGTIETLCWVLGGLLIIIGIVFSWWGLGFLVPWGMQVIRVARVLKRINDVLSPIADALAATAALLRIISALVVPAEFYGQELAGASAAGEFFGDKAGGQVADNLAEDARKHAQTEPEPPDDGTQHPAEQGQAEGEALGHELANRELDEGNRQADQVEETNRQLEEADQALADAENRQREQEQGGDDQQQDQDQDQQQAQDESEGEGPSQDPDANRRADDDEDNDANRRSDDESDAEQQSRLRRAGGLVYKYLGVEGITKQFTGVTEVRQKLRDAGGTLEDLLSGTAMGNLLNARTYDEQAAELMRDIESRRDEALQEVLAADAEGSNAAAQLASAEQKLRNMQIEDADAADVEKVQQEIDAIRNNPDLQDVVAQHDRIHQNVVRLEEQLESVRNTQREDVQGGMLDQMKDNDDDTFSANPRDAIRAARDRRRRHREAQQRTEELEGEVASRRQSLQEAEELQPQLESQAEHHEEAARRARELESRRAEQEQKQQQAQQAEGMAQTLQQVDELEGQARQKRNQANEARSDANQARDELQGLVGSGQRIQIDEQTEGGHPRRLVLKGIRDDGLVIGREERFVPWSEVTGPQDVLDLRQRHQEGSQQADALQNEARSLEDQARNQQMGLADERNGPDAWDGQSTAGDYQQQAQQLSTQASEMQGQIDEARQALESHDDSGLSAQEHGQRATELNQRAQEQRDIQQRLTQELEDRQAELEEKQGEIESMEQRSGRGDPSEGPGILHQASQAHDQQTSQPAPAESKRGQSRIVKLYLDSLIAGGGANKSNWFKVFENARSNGWQGLLGIKKKKKKAKKKKTSDFQQPDQKQVNKADEALTKGTSAGDAAQFVTDTGGAFKGLVQSGFTGLGVPPASKKLIEAPAPPVQPETLQEQWDEARDEMEENAKYHARAYNAYIMEVAVAAKVAEHHEVAEKAGKTALEHAEAQEAPIKEGLAKEQERSAKLEGTEADTKPSDSENSWIMQVIMDAISEGGDEVEGAPENAKDADPSKVQDETHEEAKATDERNKEASKEQQEYLDTLSKAQKQITSGIASDKQAVEEKAQQDHAVMLEIRGMKEENLSNAAQHYQAGEAKAGEFNASLDQLSTWAADYRSRHP